MTPPSPADSNLPATSSSGSGIGVVSAPSGRRKAFALLRDSTRELGWRYWVFVVATIGLAYASLLPPQLFHFFATELPEATTTNVVPLLKQLALFGGLIAAALMLSGLFSILAREWLRLNLQANLRRRVLAVLHGLPLESLDEAERGEWLTRMTADLQNAENFLTESIPEQIRDITVLLGVTVLFTYYCGPVAWLAIGAALMLAVLNGLIQRYLAPILHRLRGLNGEVVQSLIDNFEGKKTIRSQFAENAAAEYFDGRVELIKSKGMKVVKVLGGLMGSNQIASQLMITLVLTVVTWNFAAGAFSLSDALVVPFFIGMFFGAAQGLASSAYDWNRFIAEGGRLADLLAMQTDGTSEPPLVQLAQVKEVRYEKLSIGYRRGVTTTEVCAPLNVTLAVGSVTAFVGPSGCGKSTALEVLAGLRAPLGGRAVMINGQNRVIWQGRDLRFPRGLCSYVEQHPYIFGGSVRANLCFGDYQAASDKEMWEVLDRVGLGSVFRGRDGLETRIFDRAENLSEGQIYRLGLARALLCERPFLLMDEPFASLDEESAHRVIEVIDNHRDDHGVVVVTHHMPSELSYDSIVRFGEKNDADQKSVAVVDTHLASRQVQPSTR